MYNCISNILILFNDVFSTLVVFGILEKGWKWGMSDNKYIFYNWEI